MARDIAKVTMGSLYAVTDPFMTSGVFPIRRN